MKTHLLLSLALLMPMFIGCSEKGEEVVLQEGKNSDGSPQKIRPRLTIADAKGNMRGFGCLQTMAASAGFTAATSAAEVMAKMDTKCPVIQSGRSTTNSRNSHNWDSDSYFSIGIDYYYPESYWRRPWYNGYNYGCSNIFGSWGNSLRFNCYNDIFSYGYNYVGRYNSYCATYCGWGAFNTWGSSCYRCGSVY